MNELFEHDWFVHGLKFIRIMFNFSLIYVWRLFMAWNIKILSWILVDNSMLGIVTNYFEAILA